MQKIQDRFNYCVVAYWEPTLYVELSKSFVNQLIFLGFSQSTYDLLWYFIQFLMIMYVLFNISSFIDLIKGTKIANLQ